MVHYKTVAQVGAAAAFACCAAACYIHSQQPEFYTKAKRYITRRLPPRRPQATGPHEPGEQPWPAEGYATCRPLSTVTELLSWQPPKQLKALAPAPDAVSSQPSQRDPCACSTPLVLPETMGYTSAGVTAGKAALAPTGQSACSAGSPRQQLLVCHDMMGGYLDYESTLEGTADAAEYRIWHWDCTDVFVYFSHHLVTIPPAGWIHAAHKHGVKVLGTFITEFGQGRLRCGRMLSSCETARQVADQLVAIAAHYGFDGWLVNIENPLSQQQVSVMQHFVGYLRARTRDTCPHGLVVWYDAVTTAGKLNWQNGLTALNAPFFDLSDALFVNYTWTPPKLPTTAAAAGSRASRVFMGVDVFGRGSYGGGGFGVKHALSAAAEAGLSAALFAPGWVRENLDKARFHELQDRWWQLVQRSWGLTHPVITQLPFSTCFNTGAGLSHFTAGVTNQTSSSADSASHGGTTSAAAAAAAGSVAGASAAGVAAEQGPWYNLLATDTLPCARDPVSQQVVNGPVTSYLSACTAFAGGSCLVLCQQEQKQQEQQQEQQPATGASADASPGSCCPLLQLPASPGGDGQQLALLQLFTAHVPVVCNTAVSLSCVYASPTGTGSSSSSSAGTSTSSVPTLWLMTSSQGGDAAGTSAAGGHTQRWLHLPVAATMCGGCDNVSSSSRSSSKGVSVGPVLSAEGSLTDVGVLLVDGAAGGSDAASLDRVQLLQPPGPLKQQPAAAAPDNSEAAAAAAAAGEPGGLCGSDSCAATTWLSPLSAEVGTWQWRKAEWRVPVSAGSTIVGVGVAVGPGLQAGGDPAGASVLGLLGRVDMAVV